MPDQTARQRARRSVLDAQTKLRQRRTEQDQRRTLLAVTVVTALAERDALVRACEARAGAALRTLTGTEGLSLREALEWCGGDKQLSVREASRLRTVTALTTTPGAEHALGKPGEKSAMPTPALAPVAEGSSITPPMPRTPN